MSAHNQKGLTWEECGGYVPAREGNRRERLEIAAKIAAGMCANPSVCEGYDWRGQVARDAFAIADKLMILSESGGC